MTFPSVPSGQTSTSTSSATTSHSVTLPSGLTNGNLLIVSFCADGNAETITWPNEGTDFIVLYEDGANAKTLSVAYHKIDGTYSGSITVTTSGTQDAGHVVYEIQDAADPNTQAPEASSGATGSGSTGNPDAAAATGGTIDYMHIAISGTDTVTVNTFPTDCPDNNIQAGGGAGSATAAMASVEDTDPNFDPNQYSYSGSDGFACVTISIHPSTGIQILRRRREVVGAF